MSNKVVVTRENVLSSYRRLIRMCFALPKEKRIESLQRVRVGFRENASEQNQERYVIAVQSTNLKVHVAAWRHH